MAPKINTVIFDLDGTIIDTELTAAEVVQTAFKEWKIELHFEDAAYVTGRTWDSAIQYLYNKYPIPISKEDAEIEFLQRYRQALHQELKIVPGSVSAIQSLHRRFPLGLVSGSKRTEIEWALKKLQVEDCFQVVLGAEDYPRSKPHPDGYLKAMTLMGTRPENCLVFEDSTAGISSALAAGTWVTAITSTNHFQQEISRAHFQICDLTGITEKWIDHLTLER